MASSPNPSAARVFNNPRLSDIKIRQTNNGQIKKYHASKAILSMHSKWFFNAFTGNWLEANSDTIEVFDDDSEHFEAMLRYFYTGSLELDREPTDKDRERTVPKALQHRQIIEQKCLMPIGVYTVADKCDCQSLKDDITRGFPRLEDLCRPITIEEGTSLVEAHYAAHCGESDCKMGRAISAYLLSCEKIFMKSAQCASLVRKYPEFGRDIILVNHQNASWSSYARPGSPTSFQDSFANPTMSMVRSRRLGTNPSVVHYPDW